MWRSKEREVGGRLLKCQNTKQETWNLQSEQRERIKSFETRRLRTCSWWRKGDNSREREKRRKPICSSRLSRSCFTLLHELMSHIWPARRLFLNESIVVSVSICEIAYTVSQETIYGFQQLCCREANNHHYCEGNE